jgi:transcriptional regulator with XRE-family HTH domain
MPLDSNNHVDRLHGHALRNAHLRQRSLARAATAPPLARALVRLRAEALGMTRLEFARRSGISRGTLRDIELGVHTPTRRSLQRFLAYCRKSAINGEELEALIDLYAGPPESLEQFINRLELQAGSPRELARRVGISPATLWEYRRGNFALPLSLLQKLCHAVAADPSPGEALWLEAERQRFLKRGYPPALAEFWTLCARSGHVERDLLRLGLKTATARRLRYLEMPAWEEAVPVARQLCKDEQELLNLKKLWLRDQEQQQEPGADSFGLRLKRHREKKGISRRELADLFKIGGKKPARIIKYIEEDGFYSIKAYPAGLAAVLVGETAEARRLLDLWRERRKQFHRRHRPETRVDLRLMRELYGFELSDMQPLLGYSGLEYQRIERGVTPLLESAAARIVQALEQVGQGRVYALLQQRAADLEARNDWQTPRSVADLISLLARREGGLIPLTRFLKRAKVKGLWTGRLRAIAQGEEVPTWHTLRQISDACGVNDVDAVRLDWEKKYRALLAKQCSSPLGVELRLLIAEVAATLRDFSPRLAFNYSVLIRDLQRIDCDAPIKWFHIERILQAARLPREGACWREIHMLWYTAGARRKARPPIPRGQPVSAREGCGLPHEAVEEIRKNSGFSGRITDRHPLSYHRK